MHVLGEELEYRVDQILVVEPLDTSALQVVEGRDYLTLVTCTPYGINSHRLLVRGERTAESSGPDWERLELSGEAEEIQPMLPTFICLIVIVTIVFVVLILRRQGGPKKEAENEDEN